MNEIASSAQPASPLSAPAAEGTGALRTRVAALIALALAVASSGAMRGVFSPLQEMAKGDLGLSDFDMSLVQGLAASLPIALLSIPIGRLIDRINRVRLLAVLAVIWMAGTALTVFASSFGALFVARMLNGFGNVCALPVSISLAADLSVPERRGRALLALSMGVYAGAGAAYALGGWLTGVLSSNEWSWLAPLELTPWRAVNVFAWIAGTLLLVPLLGLREPARRERGTNTDTALRPALRELWKRRGFLLPLFVGQIGVLMADTAASIWAAPVLIRDYGLKPAQFGGWMGLVVLGSGAAGTVIGGYVADFGQKLKMRGGIVMGGVVAAAISIPAALFPVMPGVAGFAWMLILLLLTGAVAGLTTATSVAVLLPNQLRGTCLSSLFVVSAIVAFGIAPTLVTVLSGVLGGETHLARALALSGTVISAISFTGFVVAMMKAPARSS